MTAADLAQELVAEQFRRHAIETERDVLRAQLRETVDDLVALRTDHWMLSALVEAEAPELFARYMAGEIAAQGSPGPTRRELDRGCHLTTNRQSGDSQ